MISLFEDIKEKRLKKRGQKLLTKQKFEKAYHIFQKTVLLNNSVENRFNLAITLLSLSEYSKAEKYLTDIFDEFPENEINLLALAECYIMQRKWDVATASYENLYKLNPENKSYKQHLQIAKDVVAREKYVKAKELFAKATIELSKKNDKNALEILLEANEYFPQDAIIINNIATLYIMIKDFQKAYKFAMQAVALKPKDPRYQNNLKIAKRKLKK